MTEIRKGQAPAPLMLTQFRERFNLRDCDPAFDTECGAIARLENIAREAMQDGRSRCRCEARSLHRLLRPVLQQPRTK